MIIMKKKYLAWFFLSDNINQPLSTHCFLINKLAEKFENFVMINLKNLNTNFKTKDNISQKFTYNIDKKFDIKKNVEIFNPVSKVEFEKFIIDKKIYAILINNFETNPPNIKLFRYLKNFEITFFEINDISNIQIMRKLEKNFILKGIKFKLSKILYNSKFFIFSNLNLIKKFEILFSSSLSKINKLKKNFFNINILRYNFSRYKNIVKINSKAFDILNSEKIDLKENTIVLLDDHFGHPSSLEMRNELRKSDIELHYKYLNFFLDLISKEFSKEVVICIHPKDDLRLKKKLFPKYDVFQYQTREKIIESHIVIFFESTAIIDAILFKKNIITIYSDFMDENVKNASNQYKNKFGALQIKLGNEMKLNKEEILKKFQSSKAKFDDFISNYVQIDNDNFGYIKIVEYLKKYF